MTTESRPANFGGLGIAPAMLDVLDRMKFTVPTPIQEKAIPVAIEGKDLLGIAQTGTGKTLAFGIPLMQRLSQAPGRALVVVPTRELAAQVDETLRKISQPFNIRTAILIGGASMHMQVQQVRKKETRVLIATPGRLIDHVEQRTVNLSDIRIVVLDEADRMLDMGFAPQIHRIAKFLPKERQTLFFSATMPEEILKIASAYMNLPIRVEIARQGTAPEKIAQELYIVKPDMKKKLLLKLLDQYRGSVLLFSRTKQGAKKITQLLCASGHQAAEIHANRSLAQRKMALEGFKTGRYRVLVATDIASRGIDVKNIEVVLNFDLPQNSEDYVHRIGRTGRAGREGLAITFATPDEGGDIRAIERLMQTTLRISTHGEIPSEIFSSSHGAPKNPFRHGQGGRRGGGFNRGGSGGSGGYGGQKRQGGSSGGYGGQKRQGSSVGYSSQHRPGGQGQGQGSSSSGSYRPAGQGQGGPQRPAGQGRDGHSGGGNGQPRRQGGWGNRPKQRG